MCNLLQKTQQNKKPHLHFSTMSERRNREGGFWVYSWPHMHFFAGKEIHVLPRHAVCPFCLNKDCTLCSYSLSSMHGGLKLVMAPVLGTLHSCTVTSAAVLSFSPQQRLLAKKCIYLVSMWAGAPTMHTHPHKQSCSLKKTKVCFAGMVVLQPKLKTKQGRDVKLKCNCCVWDCSSQFSWKSLQAHQ